MKRFLIKVFMVCLLAQTLFSSNSIARSQLDTDQLREMTFEELMNVKISVPAALTQLTPAETPASVTVITADDIRHTPARNIYDLIEVYVPGAIWMNYEEGPQLGIRGLISNRNTKYLLRVNGQTMNNTGHYGAMSELEQWDLSDISKIEIIRGPGSVTYGPGAIAGVINITTHNSTSSPGFQATSNYYSKYKSRGAVLSYGTKYEKFSLYGYASVTRTPGFNARNFIGTKKDGAGYIGETVRLDKEPLDYFADFQDEPQIKLYASSEFLDNWKFWARYTQQGSTWHGNELKTELNGELINLESTRSRQWIATLQYEKEIGENISTRTTTSYSSADAQRQKDEFNDPNIDHVLNKKVSFGETGILFNSTLTWKTNDRIEIAFGSEFIRNSYGAPWGKGSEDMRLGDNGIIVSDSNSNAIRTGNNGSADKNSTEIFIGDGWSTNSYALFSEINLTISNRIKLLLSGRVDKNTYTKRLFSPRIAVIANVGKGQHIKLIAQKSIRRNTASQLFTEAYKGLETNTEILEGVELRYTHIMDNGMQTSITGFRNNIDIIAWEGDDNVTIPFGKLRLYGFEADLQYKWGKGKTGASYSFVKQIGWHIAPGETRSGISYSDYNQSIEDGLQIDEGNDLNNWPNHSLKTFGRISLSDQVTFHIDMRASWDFQGSKDGLVGLSNALATTVDEASVEEDLQNVREADAFEIDFRTNISISYQLLSDLRLQLQVQNLIGINNHRYSYDNGLKHAAPRNVRFTEEPRMWGMKIDFNF